MKNWHFKMNQVLVKFRDCCCSKFWNQSCTEMKANIFSNFIDAVALHTSNQQQSDFNNIEITNCTIRCFSFSLSSLQSHNNLKWIYFVRFLCLFIHLCCVWVGRTDARVGNDYKHLRIFCFQLIHLKAPSTVVKTLTHSFHFISCFTALLFLLWWFSFTVRIFCFVVKAEWS